MLKTVTIIGGGPTGLMAAYILSQHNYSVTIFERKPSLGRKFLLAGRGGLNITHSENTNDFLKKFSAFLNSLFFLKMLPATAQAYAFDGSATNACLDNKIASSLSVS